MQQWLNGLEIFNEPRATPRTTVQSISSSKASTSWTQSTTEYTNDRHYASSTSLYKVAGLKAALRTAKDAVLGEFAKTLERPKKWVDRADEHQSIAAMIFRNLSDTYTNGGHPKISFQVLVSLTRGEEDPNNQCFPSKVDQTIQSINEKGASYFIRYYPTYRDSEVVGFWNAVQPKMGEIVDAVFSNKTNHLCETAKHEIAKFVGREAFGVDDGFSGLAAVRCGYEFVWYELAYRYFTVGRLAGKNYNLTSTSDGKYDRKCGQIFLFP